MIKAMGFEIGILLLLLSGTVIEAVPTLTIQPSAPNTGSTVTLTCELAGFTTALMNFKKDGTTVYNCGSGGVTCNNNNAALSDYSQVDWSQTDKGIVTISNADQTRDGGDWTCGVGDGGGTSVAGTATLAITDADCGNPTKPTNGQVTFTTTTYKSTATYSCDSGYTLDTATTTCQTDGTWSAVPTCTADTTPPPCSDCFCQAGCTAGVIIASIFVLSWIFAIVVICVINKEDQKRLPWNLCDGHLKNWQIWLLLFIWVPIVPSVVAIYLFKTKCPGKLPVGTELDKNGPKRPLPQIQPKNPSDPEKGSPRKLPEPPNPEEGFQSNRLSPLESNKLSNITETQQANGEQEKSKKKKKKKKKPKNNQVSDEEKEKSS